MAPKAINVHATYGSKTSILISSRKEFLRKAAEKFNLDKDEIEILDIKNKKLLAVEELRDFIKVEIRKKTSYALNGRSESPDPPVSEVPERKELVKKLLDNDDLTGEERAFVVNLLEDYYHPPLKRRKEDEPAPKKPPETRNRKLQIGPIKLSACTQTEETLTNYESTLNASKLTEAIRIQSKRLASGDKIDDAIVKDLLAETFVMRRNFIIKDRPLAAFVREKYPLLFRTSEVKNELDRIFYDGKCKEFEANIEKFAPHVIGLASVFNPLLITTQRRVEEFGTAEQKKYAQEVGALLLLSLPLLKEERVYLKLEDDDSKPGDFPYIQVQAKLDDLFFDKHIFKIYVEGILLCEAVNFKEAILCLLASYFIFDIKYPEANFNTLVAFEKLFLEGNDTADSEIGNDTSQIIRCVKLKYDIQANGGKLPTK